MLDRAEFLPLFSHAAAAGPARGPAREYNPLASVPERRAWAPHGRLSVSKEQFLRSEHTCTAMPALTRKLSHRRKEIKHTHKEQRGLNRAAILFGSKDYSLE
jgi:hypothetical protein